MFQSIYKSNTRRTWSSLLHLSLLSRSSCNRRSLTLAMSPKYIRILCHGRLAYTEGRYKFSSLSISLKCSNDMGQCFSQFDHTRCWSTHGMMRLARTPRKASHVAGCGRPSRSPFSVHTMDRKNNSKKAATRPRVRSRQVCSRLSTIRTVWRSTAVRSAPTLVLSTSSPSTFTVLASEPKTFLDLTIFFSLTNKHKLVRPNSKLGVTSCGLP